MSNQMSDRIEAPGVPSPSFVNSILEQALLHKMSRDAPVRESSTLAFPASSMGQCSISTLAETSGASLPIPRSFQDSGTGYVMMGSAIHRYLQDAVTAFAGLHNIIKHIEIEKRIVDPNRHLAATIDIIINNSIALEIKTVSELQNNIFNHYAMQIAVQQLLMPNVHVFMVQVRREDGAIRVIPTLSCESFHGKVVEKVEDLIYAIKTRTLPAVDKPKCEYCNYYPCTVLDWERIFDILQERLEST